jgi:hypothetical protein
MFMMDMLPMYMIGLLSATAVATLDSCTWLR